jgi:hypothetical protein
MSLEVRQASTDGRTHVVQAKRFCDHRRSGRGKMFLFFLIEDIASHKDHAPAHRRKALFDFAIQADPIQNRHLSISDNQVVRALSQHLERHPTIRRNVRCVAVALQHLSDHGRDLLFILNDENGLPGDRRGSLLYRRRCRLRGTRWRQLDEERGAVPRGARQRQRAAVLLHDAPTQRQPEPRALPRRLGREERLEDFLLDLVSATSSWIRPLVASRRVVMETRFNPGILRIA